MNSLFLDQSIPDLVQGLNEGAIDCRDLAATTVQVVAKREPETHAWVDFDSVQLLADAERACGRHERGEPRFGLDGIPFGVKDIFNTRNFPTQMGSPAWKGFTPGNNARVVDSLTGAGALVAGKTVTAEFAVHVLNDTLNPHDSTRTPGASSSGSAAAVSAGMVPFALASQTAGSIIRPASFCGVWGMKPSFGMIPRTGILKTTDSLDTVGFVAAHAHSLRPILDHARVRGPNYPLVYRYVDAAGEHPKANGEGWRVGFVRTHTWCTATDYARRETEDLAARIAREPGFEVEEVRWPAEFEQAHAAHATIYDKSLSYYFQREAKFASRVSPVMSDIMSRGGAISVEAFQRALRWQETFSDNLGTLFKRYDIVLSLGTASSAPLRGHEELSDPSLIWTLAQVPSVAAPTFRCPGGLPFGAQFVASRWGDYRLLHGLEELVSRKLLPLGSQSIRDAEVTVRSGA